MDPSNYWATGLKYPPQSSSSRNDLLQPSLSSAAVGSNLSGLEQLLMLERQRIASGFAAGLLSQHQNLLGHAYSASTGTYPSSLLDPSGSQSLYAYAGALTQPYSAALSQPYTATVLSQPVFPGSFMSYDAHPTSIDSSGINPTTKSAASVQKRSSISDYNSLQKASSATPATVAKTASITSSLNSSGKSGYGGHMPATSDKYIRQRDTHDLDLRYNSLSNFMNSNVSPQNQTMSASQAMSANQAMSTNHSMSIHHMHSPTRRPSDAASSNVVERSNLSMMRTTPKPNPNSPMPSYLKTNTTPQRGDCNQRHSLSLLSGLDMNQFGDVNAVDLSVDLTQFNKVLESGHHGKIAEQNLSTINANDLLGQYDLNAARGGASSGGGSGGSGRLSSNQCAGVGGGQSAHDTGGSGHWLLSSQQYAPTPPTVVATVRGNQYEAITPPPAASLIFDSLYPSTSQTSHNFSSDFVSASGYSYPSTRGTGSGGIDSRLGVGVGSTHKKPGESGVGIVLPMPQTRELSSFDNETFDPLRYGVCGGGGDQLQTNLYHSSSNDQAITKLRDSMPLSAKPGFSTIAKDADSSHPIYLANINGNIYVNQYTMLQQPGDTALGDDYNPLTDFGIAAHGGGVYPTIDQAGYQSIVSEDVGYHKEVDCHEYKEADVPSRSTMLVPNVNDQELGHLTVGPPVSNFTPKASNHSPAAVLTSTTSTGILRRQPHELQPPVTSDVPVLPKLKTGNAFENSFLKFLCGEKTETLSSVTTSPIKNRPVMPKYVPEAPRRPPPPSPPEDPVTNEGVEPPVRPVKTTTKRKESADSLSASLEATNPPGSNKPATASVDSRGTSVHTAPSPTAPRKFPAKFSHKMHNRSPTATVDNGSAVVKQNAPGTSGTKQQSTASATAAGVKTSNSTTETVHKADSKRPHNAAFEPSPSSSSSSKKRSSGGGDVTDPNSQQIQWTISKRDKKEVNNSSAHIPVLVIKAVPSLEPKETN